MIGTNSILFSAVGASFIGTESALETLRGKDDVWNSMIGGCVAGGVIGLKTQRLSVAIGSCAAFAAVVRFLLSR